MSPATTPRVFFLSYARNDTDYKPSKDRLDQFHEGLSAGVATRLGVSSKDICYFDKDSIQAGTFWTAHLSQAAGTVPVAVTLYSPSYFASEWCGKEFTVFRSRAHFDPRFPQQPSGIVPVHWLKSNSIPAIAAAIQHNHAALPQAYAEVGMEGLLKLKVYSDEYEQAVDAIADQIVASLRPGLKQSANVDLHSTPSAWEVAIAADSESHKKGGITKTCFVFASDRGWEWTPYPQQGNKIGVMAQKITSELDVYYEEIPCDAKLAQKLIDTSDANIPTILFSDPDSLHSNSYDSSLRAYDGLYLPNCGAVVPWSEQSKAAGEADPHWKHLREAVCHKKTQYPPPNHEWRSIFSQQELEAKTRVMINDLRSRLLGEICSVERSSGNEGNTARVMKAEDRQLKDSAASEGIQTASPPQLQGPSK